MFDAADLAAFTDPADLGVAATYNGSATVNGVFSSRYAEPFGAGVEGQVLSFVCAAADVPDVAHGDTLVISGHTYTVRNVQPMRGGLVDLRLSD